MLFLKKYFFSNAFWIPQTSRDYVIYLIALGFGFNAGLWEPLINSKLNTNSFCRTYFLS